MRIAHESDRVRAARVAVNALARRHGRRRPLPAQAVVLPRLLVVRGGLAERGANGRVDGERSRCRRLRRGGEGGRHLRHRRRRHVRRQRRRLRRHGSDNDGGRDLRCDGDLRRRRRIGLTADRRQRGLRAHVEPGSDQSHDQHRGHAHANHAARPRQRDPSAAERLFDEQPAGGRDGNCQGRKRKGLRRRHCVERPDEPDAAEDENRPVPQVQGIADLAQEAYRREA